MVDDKNTWMIRSGRGAVNIDRFVEDNIVGIRFASFSDKGVDSNWSREELVEKFRERFTNWREGRIRNAAAQVYRFHHELAVGDSAITYDPGARLYFIGKIETSVQFHPDDVESLPYQRSVQWTHEVSRDQLSTKTRNTLGSTLTLFKVPDDAANELMRLARPKGSAPPVVVPELSTNTDDLGTIDTLGEDFSERANQFIEDMISKLDPYEMQDLVAGILVAMGYKTRVSPRGADRGVDIFASPDGLGLQEPRIFVEVKHRRNSTMGSQDLRSFLGGRKQGDRCLYVSTGGFTKDARYEAERSTVPLTLIDLASLRELLLEHYEGLTPEVRSMVPLKRVYWPADLGE